MPNTSADRLLCTIASAFWLLPFAPIPAVAAPAVKVRPSLSQELNRAGQLQVARRMVEAGSPLLAVELYRGLLENVPDNAALRLEFAQALRAGGRLDEAMAQFDQLLQSPAQIGPATAGLMRLHLELGNPDKAVAAFSALAPQERSASLLLLNGIALDRLQRHADAQESYRAGLELDGRSVGLRNNLALSLALTGQFAEAETLLRVLAASSNATPKIRQNLAFLYGLMGKTELAASIAAVDLSPSEVANNKRFFEQLNPNRP